MFLSKIVSTAIFIYGVQAGLDVATCAAGFDWNKNALGQDPCAVGSMLDASCRGLVEYTYPPLNNTQYYLPPSANNFGEVRCDCNTVMYSLYMACASCQGGQIYSWTQWIPQCDKVYVAQYPGYLAQRTTVPLWAYYDVTFLPNQTWSDAVATSIGQGSQELLGRQVSSPEPSTITPSRTPISMPPSITIYSSAGKTTTVRDLGQPSGSSPKIPTPTDSPAGSNPNNGPMGTTPTNTPTGPTPPDGPVESTPTNIPMDTTSPNNPVDSTPTNSREGSTNSRSRVTTTTNSRGTPTTTSTGSLQFPNANNQNGGKNVGAIFGAVSSVVPLTVLVLLAYV